MGRYIIIPMWFGSFSISECQEPQMLLRKNKNKKGYIGSEWLYPPLYKTAVHTEYLIQSWSWNIKEWTSLNILHLSTRHTFTKARKSLFKELDWLTMNSQVHCTLLILSVVYVYGWVGWRRSPVMVTLLPQVIGQSTGLLMLLLFQFRMGSAIFQLWFICSTHLGSQ